MTTEELLENYIQLLKNGKPNLSAIKNVDIYELMSITRNNEVTLSTVLLFSPYPQAYFPQLCITAIAVPGEELGELGEAGERFLDNERIEGNYGRIRADQLGKVQPDTRNPVLALALEVLGITENRYSGIPIIRKEMERYHLREPEFIDERGNFVVKFYKAMKSDAEKVINSDEKDNLILFCKTPRTRKEICEYLGLSSITYAIQTHVMPLVERGEIKLSIPDKPKSPKQLFYSE